MSMSTDPFGPVVAVTSEIRNSVNSRLASGLVILDARHAPVDPFPHMVARLPFLVKLATRGGGTDVPEEMQSSAMAREYYSVLPGTLSSDNGTKVTLVGRETTDDR